MADTCPQRLKLAKLVSEAIEEKYRAKADLDSAKRKGADIRSLFLALSIARSKERNAQRILSQHIEEHGCK
jgi:hypothetical protein